METQPPKAFVSHASEDKERFVNSFAEKLIANGVDAWVDRWEMLPGDSLVDKIFEEGIKNAQAMIIVLSNYSVNKKWVREELNAGIVKKISGNTKLIPVVIDECEVPEALKSTIWEKIKDINSYEEEFQRILAAIFGTSLKPPIGAAPNYVRFQIDTLPNLTKIDTIVFKLICEKSLQKGIDWIGISDISTQTQELGIAEDAVFESVEVLNNNYLIKGTIEIGGSIDFFRITTHGFETFARYFLPEFDNLLKDTLISIVNQNLDNDESIANHLNQSKVLVYYVLDILANRGYFKVTHTNDGVFVHSLSAQGKRAARELSG
jgi:hypothetical protein